MLDQDMQEKKIASEEIYDGTIVHLFRDAVLLPNGKESVREVVRHMGAVAVVALNERDEVYFVRQFRYPFSRVTLEIPAGKLERGEAHSDAAMRELREETGLIAGKLSPIGEFYSSPAILDEVIYLYLATDLAAGEAHPDADEFLNVVRMPLCVAADMVLSGQIKDGKTQSALLMAYCSLHKGETNSTDAHSQR